MERALTKDELKFLEAKAKKIAAAEEKPETYKLHVRVSTPTATRIRNEADERGVLPTKIARAALRRGIERMKSGA